MSDLISRIEFYIKKLSGPGWQMHNTVRTLKDAKDALEQAQTKTEIDKITMDNFLGQLEQKDKRIEQLEAENERLNAAVKQFIAADAKVGRLEAALKVYEDIVADSSGVDGYHLNGDIALWGEFELPAITKDTTP